MPTAVFIVLVGLFLLALVIAGIAAIWALAGHVYWSVDRWLDKKYKGI